MIKSIETLPNYYNGKVHFRWHRVMSVFGDDSVLAIKTDKNRKPVELLISGNKKRELYTTNGKIMDIVDENNVKRTYIYEREDNVTKGKMIVENIKDERKQPFIVAAEWIIKNFVPQEIRLKLNPNHPKSKFYIPKSQNEDLRYISQSSVKEVKASEFSNKIDSLPSKLEFTMQDGSVLTADSPYVGNIFASTNLDKTKETHPLEHIYVVV